MTQPTPNPWQQQPDEPDKQYEYFIKYRDLGRVRTLTKVAEQFTKTDEWMRICSAKHNWVKRAQAWDTEQDRMWALEVQTARKNMAKEHAAVADAMMEKVFERIATLDIEDMKPEHISKWAEVATKTKRLAYGEPETNMALTGPGGGPIQVDVTNMTVEERKERFKQLIEEAQHRTNGDQP